MSRTVTREPQEVSKAEFLSKDLGLPERLEWVRGAIGPFSDDGKLALLVNWGADDIVRLTGPEVWREAIAASGASNQDQGLKNASSSGPARV